MDRAGKLVAIFLEAATGEINLLLVDSRSVDADVGVETVSPLFSLGSEKAGSGVNETTGCNDLPDDAMILDKLKSDSWLAASLLQLRL